MKNDSILRQVTTLLNLSGRELRSRYVQLFGGNPPNGNKQFLIKRLAHRIQELAYNQQLSQKSKALLDAALEDEGYDPKTGKKKAGIRARDRRTVQIEPGVSIEKEYRGEVYRVTALRGGQWEYQGRTYTSLSNLAAEITGTHRSGPEFFGLTEPKPKRSRRRN